MPMLIDPFDFAPLGAFNYLHAYLMCTWMRAQYHSDAGNPAYDDVIKSVIGALTFSVSAHRQVGGNIYPRIDVALIPGRPAVVMVRGTSIIPDELFSEISRSDLVHSAPWAGSVSNYFSLVATEAYQRVQMFLDPNWLAAGHSLGGAIACMMGQNGAAKYFTAGSPREGNAIYANSRPTPVKLRITTAGDPVPYVPFSSGTPFDLFDVNLGNFIINQNYKHWGVRKVVQTDGSVIFPPDEERDATLLSMRGIVSGGTRFLLQILSDGANIHLAPTYCFRLRIGIPFVFPVREPVVDFPGLFELDTLNATLNADRPPRDNWSNIKGLKGEPPQITRRSPSAPEVPPNLDPYQFICE